MMCVIDTNDFAYSFGIQIDINVLSTILLCITDRNYEKVCEACYITLNKCAIYGSISPGGVRIGEFLSYSMSEVTVLV